MKGPSSKSRQTRRQGSRRRETTNGRATSAMGPKHMLVGIGLGVIAIGVLIAWAISSARPAPEAAPVPVTTEPEPPAPTPAPPPPSSQPVDLKVVVGRWVRTDSPYVIENHGGADDGKLDAAYYNPRSINVSRAEAKDKLGKLEVFVELRDAGYPGSTYTLTYDRSSDTLQGVYFQAAMRQTYDVVFARMQE